MFAFSPGQGIAGRCSGEIHEEVVTAGATSAGIIYTATWLYRALRFPQCLHIHFLI